MAREDFPAVHDCGTRYDGSPPVSCPDPGAHREVLRTRTGKVLDDAEIKRLADEAEAGYSVGTMLARQQIRQHGKDRYPTPKQQAEKLLIEAAELLGAIIEHQNSSNHRKNHELKDCVLVKGESADAGLSLYTLMDKLGIDLEQCMAMVVSTDRRRFA